tara:strand:- start:54 stop:170 length:117 start_codon:yes stop_codon:yes gene_type:complete
MHIDGAVIVSVDMDFSNIIDAVQKHRQNKYVCKTVGYF